MPAAIKERCDEIRSGAVVVLAAAIPFGLSMAWFMDDPSRLWFCGAIITFLS
jgi:hypothetical protein